VSGISLAMLANRVSYHFNLMGSSATYCTACSAGLTALHAAMNALACGDCDQALVGAVTYLGSARMSSGFNLMGVISPDGTCHSFDAEANGYMRSEGSFVFALRPLAAAERDVYGPGVTRSGDVVYRSQWYMVSLSAVPAAGGDITRITTFQSETPTWDPAGVEVSFTFGGWRIATDDVDYPDIDQHIGIVAFDGQLPREAPDRIVRQSYSEDQGMHWSPNGRWITYHSHIDATDDIYLIPADDPSSPRLISAHGHETGWPRWSPDGRWIAFPSYTVDASGGRKSYLYVIPVDQETGETASQQPVPMGDFPHDALQAEWTPDSEALIFEAAEGPGRKALYRVPRDGGEPQRFHEWESNQVHSGIAVSPRGDWVAYIGPGSEGFFQVHRVPIGGGQPEQLTVDATQKTQPAYDPAGEWLAYTVFSYEARFWRLER
jgi:Tol biopolymer transport system component